MDSSPQKKSYWPKVHSPSKREKSAVASFHLFVRGKDVTKMWTKVDELTKGEHLGYMSSIAQEAMAEGPYKGFKCISVHYEEAKKDGVYKNLQKFTLDHFIQKESGYRSVPKEDMLAKKEKIYGRGETNEGGCSY